MFVCRIARGSATIKQYVARRKCNRRLQQHGLQSKLCGRGLTVLKLQMRNLGLVEQKLTAAGSWVVASDAKMSFAGINSHGISSKRQMLSLQLSCLLCSLLALP